jgi:hypothetical protein
MSKFMLHNIITATHSSELSGCATMLNNNREG